MSPNIHPFDSEEGNADHEGVSQPTTPTFTPEQRSAYPIKDITKPGPNDSLFGRGGGTNHHPGNKSYRASVESRKDLYSKSTRLEKPLVAAGIISDWRELSPPGRFLKQDDKTNLWLDVGDRKAREKTSQALREKTPVNSREEDQNDCLFGRGGGTNHHPGNKSYRAIVESLKDLYSKSEKSEKSSVAMRIISDWRELSPPGRFLKQDDKTELWEDIGDKKAREKTSQALREKNPVNSREEDGSGDGGSREEEEEEDCTI